MDESWIDAMADGTPPSTPSPQQAQPQEMTAVEYLSQYVGADEVASIIDKLGAVTMDDLKLVDKEMAEEAVSGMKLIPKKKALDALLKAAEPTAPEGAVSGSPATPAATPATSSTESAAPVAPKRVEECVAIAIDRSGSMGCGFDEQQAWCDDGNTNALKKTLEKRSRMDAVKQVFYAFRDRTETLGVGETSDRSHTVRC